MADSLANPPLSAPKSGKNAYAAKLASAKDNHEWLSTHRYFPEAIRALRRVFEKRFVSGPSVHTPGACWFDLGSIRASEEFPLPAGGRFIVTLNGVPPAKGPEGWRPTVRFEEKKPGPMVRGKATWETVGKTDPLAPRAWLFQDAWIRGKFASGEDLTVSHICHEQGCVNPWHFIVECLAYNKGRSGCLGPALCAHVPPCAKAGRGVFDSSGDMMVVYTLWGGSKRRRHELPKIICPYLGTEESKREAEVLMTAWYVKMKLPARVCLPDMDDKHEEAASEALPLPPLATPPRATQQEVTEGSKGL